MASTPTSSSTQLFAVFVPKAVGSPAGEVFKSLREASSYATSPLPKRYGARFKRFDPREVEQAHKYAVNGDGDNISQTVSTKEKTSSEPVVPYPSVSRPRLNEVKRAIEALNNDQFVKLAEENPRVLINTSADTPTIIAEGCRYNALHVAAKSGNAFVTQYVLDLVQDHRRLSKIYGTADVDVRSQVLLENFLTTPDKGENSSPLLFASKFGHTEIVALLTAFSVCKLNTRNKFELSPADVVCQRYSGGLKNQRSESIRKLLGAYYIGLYRSSDCSSFPILGSPVYRYPVAIINPTDVNTTGSGDGPEKRITVTPARITPLMSRLNAPNVGQSTFLGTYNLSAVAGPFESEMEARKFFNKWNTTGRKIKLSDANSGHEKVGRELAEAEEVTFVEFSAALDKMVTTYDPYEEKFFDAEEGEEEIPTGGGTDAEEGEEENSPGDITLLCAKLNDLSVNSSFNSSTRSSDGDHSDDDVFVTPPSSPEPVL